MPSPPIVVFRDWKTYARCFYLTNHLSYFPALSLLFSVGVSSKMILIIMLLGRQTLAVFTTGHHTPPPSPRPPPPPPLTSSIMPNLDSRPCQRLIVCNYTCPAVFVSPPARPSLSPFEKTPWSAVSLYVQPVCEFLGNVHPFSSPAAD